jgi:aflatoxin B1 aldehyde reductase
MDELHKEGRYNLMGVSNYTAAEVEEFCKVTLDGKSRLVATSSLTKKTLHRQLATEHGLIKPSVYQGNYSLLCRRGDTELFPLLRKEGISFYAYSPLAMGMLTGGKQKESLEAARTLPPGSR